MTVTRRLERAKEWYVEHEAEQFYRPYTEEGALLEHAIDFLELAGALVNREAFATRRGVSDLITCFNGRFIALELKDDEGAPSAQQLKYIDKVHKAGGIAYVCRTLADIYGCLQVAIL